MVSRPRPFAVTISKVSETILTAEKIWKHFAEKKTRKLGLTKRS